MKMQPNVYSLCFSGALMTLLVQHLITVPGRHLLTTVLNQGSLLVHWKELWKPILWPILVQQLQAERPTFSLALCLWYVVGPYVKCHIFTYVTCVVLLLFFFFPLQVDSDATAVEGVQGAVQEELTKEVSVSS